MNKNALKAAIISQGLTAEKLSAEMKMSDNTFSEKINCKVRPSGIPAEFTQSEIAFMKNRLGLSDEDVIAIFFST